MKRDIQRRINKGVFITVTILVFLTLAFYLITFVITKYTGFAVSGVDATEKKTCLESKRITLFINSPDSETALRNLKLGEGLREIEIFNCFKNPDHCDSRGMKEFPTYIINGERHPYDMSLDELKREVGC